MTTPIVWELVLAPLAVALVIGYVAVRRARRARVVPAIVHARSCPQCDQGVHEAVIFCPICRTPTVAARRRGPALSSFTPRLPDGRLIAFHSRPLVPLRRGGDGARGGNRSTNTVEEMAGFEAMLDPRALRWMIVSFLLVAAFFLGVQTSATGLAVISLLTMTTCVAVVVSLGRFTSADAN
jgi:hypothetical protein